MNLIKAIPFVIIFTACSSANSNITPEFNITYFTGLESEKLDNYNNIKLDYDLTDPNGKNIHFDRCTDVDKINDNDIAASEFHLITMLKLNCKALALYLNSKAAKTSYIGELVIDKNINNLPATAYPYVNDEDKISRINKTLKQFHSKLQVNILEDGSVEATTESDMLLYQIISTGDFNNDGLLDALIRIDWHVIDAFGKGSKLIMISRNSNDTPFKEIEY